MGSFVNVSFVLFIVVMLVSTHVSTAKETILKSNVQTGRHLDSILVMKAYNSLIEAGKSMEELIKNHGNNFAFTFISV